MVDSALSSQELHRRSVGGGEGRPSYDLVDPVTGEKYAEAPRSQPEDVEHAFRVAQDAFGTWSTTTPSQRSLALIRFADALEARTDELVDIECRNTGKPRSLTTSEEIPPMIDQIRFFAGACRLLEGRSAGEYMEGSPRSSAASRSGVCAQITPVELPDDDGGVEVRSGDRGGQHRRAQAGRTPRRPARPSWPRWPPSSSRPACFNVVCGHNHEMGAALLDEPRSPAWSPSRGAYGPGREIARAAAEDIKRVHLELGGKAPAIVFDDADVESDRGGHRHGRATSTPGRTARRRRGFWPVRGSTTTWSPL